MKTEKNDLARCCFCRFAEKIADQPREGFNPCYDWYECTEERFMPATFQGGVRAQCAASFEPLERLDVAYAEELVREFEESREEINLEGFGVEARKTQTRDDTCIATENDGQKSEMEGSPLGPPLKKGEA